LQHLTVAGFRHACSLKSFSAKTVHTIIPQDLPADFLSVFTVDYVEIELLSVAQMDVFKLAKQMHVQKNFHSKSDMSDCGSDSGDENESVDQLDIGAIYPNDASMCKLLLFLVNHVTQIQALRHQSSINILVIGCEDPFFIFELYVRLCFHFQHYVQCVQIFVIDKNNDVIKRWHALALSMNEQFPLLCKHVQFQLINFMNYDNTLMSGFDIVVTLIVGSITPSFSLKFVLLALQHNERPYYSSSKIFLAPRMLFATATQNAEKVCFRVHHQVQMTYFCRTRTNDDRDLYYLTVLQAAKDKGKLKASKDKGKAIDIDINPFFFRFSYYRTDHEDPSYRCQHSALHNAFRDAVRAEIVHATDLCFAGLFGRNYNKLFSDVVTNFETQSSILKCDQFEIEQLVVTLPHCRLTIFISEIKGLLSVVRCNEDCRSSNSLGFLTQQDMINNTKAGISYKTSYLQRNVSNAYMCLESMQCAIFQYMRMTLKAVDISFDEFTRLENMSKSVLQKYSCAVIKKHTCHEILTRASENAFQAGQLSSKWTIGLTNLSKSVSQTIGTAQLVHQPSGRAKVSNFVVDISYSQQALSSQPTDVAAYSSGMEGEAQLSDSQFESMFS
jgi:hypothetical protein